MARVTRIVVTFGDSAWVSQLSSSYQAMLPAVCNQALAYSFSVQVLGRALTVAQLWPYVRASEGDTRSSGGEFRVCGSPRLEILTGERVCWRSGDDVTREVAGPHSSVAALGLELASWPWQRWRSKPKAWPAAASILPRR